MPNEIMNESIQRCVREVRTRKIYAHTRYHSKYVILMGTKNGLLYALKTVIFALNIKI
jgi:hypothetical protein